MPSSAGACVTAPSSLAALACFLEAGTVASSSARLETFAPVTIPTALGRRIPRSRGARVTGCSHNLYREFETSFPQADPSLHLESEPSDERPIEFASSSFSPAKRSSKFAK